MSKLYIANVTKQHHDFAYRLPGEDMATYGRMSYMRIQAGQQEQIPPGQDLPLPVLEAIVEQYRVYGIMSADDAVRTRGYVWLVFSFDKPVDMDRMHYAFDHNKGVLFDQGERQRRELAVAVGDGISRELNQPLREVELEVLEEAESPSAAHGLRVVNDAALASEGGVRIGRGR